VTNFIISVFSSTIGNWYPRYFWQYRLDASNYFIKWELIYNVIYRPIFYISVCVCQRQQNACTTVHKKQYWQQSVADDNTVEEFRSLNSRAPPAAIQTDKHEAWCGPDNETGWGCDIDILSRQRCERWWSSSVTGSKRRVETFDLVSVLYAFTFDRRFTPYIATGRRRRCCRRSWERSLGYLYSQCSHGISHVHAFFSFPQMNLLLNCWPDFIATANVRMNVSIGNESTITPIITFNRVEIEMWIICRLVKKLVENMWIIIILHTYYQCG